MKKQNELGTFTVVTIDMMDAYPYADIFDDFRYGIIGKNYGRLGSCIALADRMFMALNPNIKTRKEWEEREGHDVRVYDGAMSCVYKAHEILSN